MQNQNSVAIQEIVLGEGAEVTKGCLVFINFRGCLENSIEFDSTARHGRPYEFVVGSKKVIQGMSLALLGMKVGGKRIAKIPAELGYGDRQVGDKIPANSNLIFEIELLESRPREN